MNAYMGLQIREIEEHKYYLSEKAGHDVGIDFAVNHWVETGEAEKYRDRFLHNARTIEAMLCALKTHEDFRRLRMDYVHFLLGDK
jgi:hypothetical protein